MIEKVSSFLNEFKFEDIPKVAIDNSLRSFVDLIGVAASATQTDLSKIIGSIVKIFMHLTPIKEYHHQYGLMVAMLMCWAQHLPIQ